MGGPDAIPGLRQLFAKLRREKPDAAITKILGTMQEWSIAGKMGVDVGAQIGFGWIPGASTDEDLFQKYQDDLWGTVAGEVTGPSVRDAVNLYKDIESGNLDLKHNDWVDILGTRSASGISVTMQKGVRGLKEWEDRYIEYSRERKGPELSEKDVISRALGIDTTDIARRRQEYNAWSNDVDYALKERQDLLDKFVRVRKDIIKRGGRSAPQTKEMKDLYNELHNLTKEQVEFNREYYPTLALKVDGDAILEAHRISLMDLEKRVASSRLAEKLLRERLKPYAVPPD
jgi:hypothetical protein